jgi:Ca-activated chloride channel family protein
MRRWIIGLTRLLFLASVAGATFHVALPRPVTPVLRCYVVDVSGSLFWGRVTQGDPVLRALEEDIDRGGPDDRYALIAFAGEPALLLPPSPRSTFLEFLRKDLREFLCGSPFDEAAKRGLHPDRTRIEDALDLALTLLRRGPSLQLVLLTDGGETAGDARRAAARLRRLSVPWAVIPLGPIDPPDIRLASVRAPSRVPPGIPFDLEVDVTSTVASTVSIQVRHGGRPLASRDVPVRAGAHDRFVFAGLNPAGDETDLDVLLVPSRPEDDLCAENNRLSLDVVRAKPDARRVLISAPPGPRSLESRLTRDPRFQVTRSAEPGHAPFDLVILDDMPWDRVPAMVRSSISDWVAQLGAGLLVAGGPHGLALGGYAGEAAIEPLLPVWAAPDERLALAIVLDRSSSMGTTADGRRPKIEVAREALRRVLPLLHVEDRLALLAFNEQVLILRRPLSPPPESEFNALLRGVNTQLGTLLVPPIRKALDLLGEAGTGLRHILLVSDGETREPPALFSELARDLRDRGVSLTFIVTGRTPSKEALDALLPDPRSGNRCITLEDWNQIEKLIEEDIRRKKDFILKGPVPVTAGPESPLRAGLTDPPSLKAANRTTLRADGLAIWQGPGGAPVLAVRQAGAGRTAVLATCLDDEAWGGSWQSWQPDLAQLIDRLAGYLTAGRAAVVELTAFPEEGRLRMTASWRSTRLAEGTTAPPEPRLPASLTAHTRLPDGRAVSTRLDRVAELRYEGSIPAELPGRYAIRVEAPAAASEASPATAGTLLYSMPYAEEWRELGQRKALLASMADAGGGRVVDSPARFHATRSSTWTLQDALSVWLAAALAFLAMDVLLTTFWHEAGQPKGLTS